MFKQFAAAALLIAAAISVGSAQTKKPAAAKGVTYDMSITADGGVYTGTMLLVTAAAKVTGDMHVKQPTEITGKVAGTTKSGEMSLDFPYHMVQRNCDGQIAMKFKAPAKGGGTKGTVTILGCGRDASNKLAGTIELKPVK
jgi:hypothetical protein